MDRAVLKEVMAKHVGGDPDENAIAVLAEMNERAIAYEFRTLRINLERLIEERLPQQQVQETPAERPRRRPHPLMPPGGWTEETYQIAAAVERERRFGPATPPPPPLPATHEDEMVDVVPTMQETLAIIWAWLRFRRTPKPSPEVIERELCRRKWKEASRAAARRR